MRLPQPLASVVFQLACGLSSEEMAVRTRSRCLCSKPSVLMAPAVHSGNLARGVFWRSYARPRMRAARQFSFVQPAKTQWRTRLDAEIGKEGIKRRDGARTSIAPELQTACDWNGRYGMTRENRR